MIDTNLYFELSDNLCSYLNRYPFGDEEKQSVTDTFNKVAKNGAAIELFVPFYLSYRDEHKLDFPNLLKCFDEMAKLTDMHMYRLNLPFFIILSTHAKYFYDEKGIGDEIYYRSMQDFMWKLYECKKLYGFCGSRTTKYYERWFFATRVALGRLQFELMNSDREYKSNSFHIMPNDKFVNIHIPGDLFLPFDKENREMSYSLAREFFKDSFEGGKVIFRCASWLLMPEHDLILSENSNIRKFMSEFEICQKYNSNGDLWRVFNTEKIYDDPTLYPNKTSLQRAYIKFLSEGGVAGGGIGFKY